jgi:hypothetical protein
MKPHDPNAPVGDFANESLDTVIDLALKRDEAERFYHLLRLRTQQFLTAAGMILGGVGLYHEGYIGNRTVKDPNPVALPIALGAALALGSLLQMTVDCRDKKRGTLLPGQSALDWDEELYEFTDKAPNFEAPQFKYAQTPAHVKYKRQKRVLELV